jgi:dUTPase
MKYNNQVLQENETYKKWGTAYGFPEHKKEALGLLIRDRSSMAMKGVTTSGGVIDAGHRGEIKVLMTN